jgi:hypothetical protein
VSHRRLAALTAAAAAALLVGCGDDDEPAARVGRTTISQDDVVGELEAIAANRGYVETIESAGGRVLGDAEDTFDTTFVASLLALQVRYAIVGNEVDRRELVADDACTARAREGVVERLSTFSGDGDGAAVLAGFDAAYQQRLVAWETDLLLLGSDLVGETCAGVDQRQEDVRQAFGSWFAAALQGADVVVDRRYGIWDERSADIQREAEDEPASLPSEG